MKEKLILAVNPGSTSTKFALYVGEAQLFEKTLRHTASELEGFHTMTDQLPFRYRVIMEALRQEGADLSNGFSRRGKGWTGQSDRVGYL
ncbi:MAG: hypothetical protein U5L72_19115 [Bacteroidales bacterium]|nr:hypothetical protein [Bacteroidales bacterium]